MTMTEQSRTGCGGVSSSVFIPAIEPISHNDQKKTRPVHAIDRARSADCHEGPALSARARTVSPKQKNIYISLPQQRNRETNATGHGHGTTAAKLDGLTRKKRNK